MLTVSVGLFLGRRGLGGLSSGEHGAVGAGAREGNGEADRGEHETDGGVGRELCEEICRSTGSECGLRTLAAEGTGEVSGLALLEEDDADKEEGDDDVNDYEKIDHLGSFQPL